MKVLHTSDLHLGKSLLEESFYEDQKYMLEEIIQIIKEKKVEVIMISGDIYDKNIPSVDAVHLLNKFLNDLSKENIEVLIISGNHDSNERLSFGSNLFDQLNIHIETEYKGKLKKYTFHDTNFYLLPFVKPFHLKGMVNEEEYRTINNSNDMMKWILKNEMIDKSKKNILLAHQFVMNTGENIEFSDSESMTNVGTLDAIDVNLLEDFDYVALGHIHKPQKIKRETIRYSGTPLKYSFSEVNDKKSVVIIDTETMDVEFVSIKPLRELRVIKGTFKEILNMTPNNDLIRVELEDTNTIISPMEEIRKKFPNALSLSFTNRISNENNTLMSKLEVTSTTSPISLFKDFFYAQNNRDLTEEEETYMNNLISTIGKEA